MNANKTCDTCIWADQCGRDAPCEDYSPLDDSSEAFTYYEQILAEAAAEYDEFVAEMEE